MPVKEGMEDMKISLKPRPVSGIVLAVACMALGLGPAAAQDIGSEIQKTRAEIAQAKKDIQKAEMEIRKTDSLLREESTRGRQSEERLARDRERREKENEALQARLRDIQGKIDAERSGLARRQNGIDEIKAREKSLGLVLAGYCDSVAVRISGAVPWDLEPRLDRIKALKKDLEAGLATLDEGFARLTSILKEEVKAGDEIALLNKPVTRKNGEVVNAQVLKIGNQWLVYMDEEGKRFGVLERKPGPGGAAWEWREDPDFAEKNRIRDAVEVKAAKRPPQLVNLTLGIAPGVAPPGGASTPAPAAAPAAKGGL